MYEVCGHNDKTWFCLRLILENGHLLTIFASAGVLWVLFCVCADEFCIECNSFVYWIGRDSDRAYN